MFPPLKLREFVDDITALLMDKNKVVAEMTKKVMRRLREAVERKGVKLSVNENGKEGKSKMIAVGVAAWNAARKKEWRWQTVLKRLEWT